MRDDLRRSLKDLKGESVKDCIGREPTDVVSGQKGIRRSERDTTDLRGWYVEDDLE